VLFAAVSKGGFGSGAAFAATPLLALVVEPAQAVGLMLPLLMLMDVASLRAYWGRWSWPHARRLMAGGVAGVAAGMLLFRAVSEDGVRLMVGAVAVGFVAYRIARDRGWLAPPAAEPPPALGLAWGAVTGFTSAVSHAGGPPAAMYLLGCRLDKTRYQATTVLVFWWINVIKFVPYLELDMFTLQSARANLLLAPVAVLGVMLGARLHHRIAETWYFRFTYALLLATGGKLVYDALT
jgi:uncharacterized membrane protein YfcA